MKNGKLISSLLALAFTSSVGAVDLTVGLGASQFSSDNGTWYQEEFKHSLNLISPSVKIQLEQPINKKYTIGVGYLYLGKVSSYAEASASDEDHSWPLSHWYGYGDVKGFFLQGKRNFQNGVFITGGGYYYKPTWHEYVPDWRACSTCPTQYLEISHTPTWKWSPMYGIGYKQGNMSIELTQVWANADEGSVEGTNFPALYKHSTTSLFYNYIF